jgi:hypothetical protein
MLKELRINKSISTPIGKKVKGDTISIQCDVNGMPLDLFWRNRIKDSAIDHCVEFVEKQKPIITKKKKDK